jgi:class III poly(R)-hydroxyalkanoic acid synthase PhaE subunit
MSKQAFWDQDWSELQRRYWENWSDMSRRAMGLDTPPANPWEQAMDHWRQAVAPGMAEPVRGFMDKMLDQGKAFFRLSEEFTRNLQPDAGGDWATALERSFGDLQKAFSGAFTGDGQDSMQKLMAFWEMPLDNWQRMLSSLSLMPGDLLRNMPHGAGNEQFERFLSAPGLGYTREEQGQQQELMRRLMDYQRALQDYSQFFADIGMCSVDCMRRKLLEKDDQAKPVDSARQLYDLWVQSCEEVYAEQVSTPRYAQLHGRLVNALMALKRHQGKMVDEALGAMDMPTRSELRTLQDRLQQTRRDNQRLRSELDALSEQVAGLAQPRPAATAPAPARTPATRSAKKKAAPRRKTATKPASPKTSEN